MAFLPNSQAQGVSGKNEQSTQTPLRGAPESQGPMQLHRLKVGPGLQPSSYEPVPDREFTKCILVVTSPGIPHLGNLSLEWEFQQSLGKNLEIWC